MYSGTTLRRKSGNIFGVHQRINRVARRVVRLETEDFFPSIKNIQHFEGKNGPDGIKSKRPGIDEPWHFIDPSNPIESPIITDITDHLYNLSQALKIKDEIKSAFEAAWLSHVITDGLTPAHHFPLDDKIEDLSGESHSARDTYRKKLVISGDSRRDTMRKNWEFWGAKGVMTSHLLFEWGIASTTMTLRTKKIKIEQSEIDRLSTEGFLPFFYESLQDIHRMHMYESFCKKGWTPKVALQAKNILIPKIIHTVALAWYATIVDKK
jgi:hypothetical protein